MFGQDAGYEEDDGVGHVRVVLLSVSGDTVTG